MAKKKITFILDEKLIDKIKKDAEKSNRPISHQLERTVKTYYRRAKKEDIAWKDISKKLDSIKKAQNIYDEQKKIEIEDWNKLYKILERQELTSREHIKGINHFKSSVKNSLIQAFEIVLTDTNGDNKSQTANKKLENIKKLLQTP